LQGFDRTGAGCTASFAPGSEKYHYGIVSPAAFLRWDTLDDRLIQALREDYRKAPLTDAERVMVDDVVKLTRVSPEDHGRLRAAGYDDRVILQITLIASWFNDINRVADSLGAGRS
jgi:alkylhydroperoxidase family enzyme